MIIVVKIYGYIEPQVSTFKNLVSINSGFKVIYESLKVLWYRQKKEMLVSWVSWVSVFYKVKSYRVELIRKLQKNANQSNRANQKGKING